MIVFLFFLLFLLVLVELVKGLSANGTPPLLQKYSWQMDLAYFMWSNIRMMRIVLIAAIISVLLGEFSWGSLGLTLALGSFWAGIYYVFNHYWVGRVKFQPIGQMVFKGESENEIAADIQVMGVDLGGEQKAYPVPMLFYHHQISDTVGDQPVWATYCGLCRSGRIYDRQVEGQALTFTLVGAITFNAVFRDHQTGTWWRQETGEAAKGPMAGKILSDVWVEQMSLKNWLDKHPDSLILQHDPTFAKKYGFLAKLMAYEASLPGWHRQDSPPLIIGVEVEGAARAYDFEQLKKRYLVNDTLNGTALLVLSDGVGSGFVYEREGHEFELTEDGVKDTATGSTWDLFGRCVKGKLKGQALTQVQSRQQFLRAWIDFHGHTDFYEF